MDAFIINTKTNSKQANRKGGYSHIEYLFKSMKAAIPSNRRYTDCSKGFRLRSQWVGSVAMRWFLFLFVLITLFSSYDQFYYFTSPFFRSVFFLPAEAATPSISTSFLTNTSARENDSDFSHAMSITSTSTLAEPPDLSDSSKQLDVSLHTRETRLIRVKPKRMPTRKEYEDDKTNYPMRTEGVHSRSKSKDRSSASFRSKRVTEDEGGDGLSSWEMMVYGYSVGSTLRCGTTDAYCPFNAPICCGDRGSYFCIPAGFQCCPMSIEMKGDSYCSQSETCCAAGGQSICCDQGTQCSTAVIPIYRNTTKPLINATSSRKERSLSSTESLLKWASDENSTDKEEEGEEAEVERWIEVPQCIPSPANCSSYLTQDACVNANYVQNSTSSLQCGWCCKEHRCITFTASDRKNESSRSLQDRELASSTTTTSSGSSHDIIRITHPSLRISSDDSDKNKENSSWANDIFENATCMDGSLPINSLSARCRSTCNYYSTCTLCTAPKPSVSTIHASRSRISSTVGDMMAYFSDFFSKESRENLSLTSSSEYHVQKVDNLGVEDSCLWCLSTEQCVSRSEYYTCPNAQFLLYEGLCELSWYDPPLTHKWRNLFFSVIFKVMAVIFLISMIPTLYRDYKERQREEAGLMGIPRPQQLLPQYAVRRYGFSYVNPSGSSPSLLHPDSSVVETQPTCVNCGVKISIDPGSGSAEKPPRQEEETCFTHRMAEEVNKMGEEVDEKSGEAVFGVAHPPFPSPPNPYPSLFQEGLAHSSCSGNVGFPIPPNEKDSPYIELDKCSRGDGNNVGEGVAGVTVDSFQVGVTDGSTAGEGAIMKEEKVEVERYEEECVSHFITFLPCGDILCEYCVEEYVKDFHCVRLVLPLRRWWRWLQRKCKWLPPRHRRLGWGTGRALRHSRATSSSTSTKRGENVVIVETEGGRNATGQPVIENVVASSALQASSRKVEKEEEKGSIKRMEKYQKRTRSRNENLERVPLLANGDRSSTEYEPDGSTGIEEEEGSGEVESREGYSEGARELHRGNGSLSGLAPLSAPLQEGGEVQQEVQEESAAIVTPENRIPTLEELMEAFHRKCPYCFRNVEDIFFADRLHRI